MNSAASNRNPQAWLLGGAPTAALFAALLLAGVGAAVNATLLRGSSHAEAAWRLWRGVLGATGFAMLPQVRRQRAAGL